MEKSCFTHEKLDAEEENANMIIGNRLINLSLVDCHHLHVDPSYQQTVLQCLECIDYLEQAMCHKTVFLGLKGYSPFKNPAHHKLVQGKHFESRNFLFGAYLIDN